MLSSIECRLEHNHSRQQGTGCNWPVQLHRRISRASDRQGLRHSAYYLLASADSATTSTDQRMHKQVGRRPVALFAMAIDLVAYFCANMAAQTEHQPHWHGDLASSFAPSVCGYACLAGLLDGELSHKI